MQLRYVFSELGQGLRRNLSMHIAVILTLFVSLTLVGLGVLLNQQADKAAQHWGSQLQITVWLCKDKDDNPACTGEVTDAQKDAIAAEVEKNPEVADYRFESKEEAFEKVKELLGPEKFDGPNPAATADDMPQSVWITLKDPEQYQGITSAVVGLDGVSGIRDMRDVLKPIYGSINALQWAALATAAFLVFAALLLVGNTIRLAAFARRKEIGIMRLVGASTLYIALPFLLEALVTAIIGVALAGGALAAFMYFGIDQRAATGLAFMPWIGMPEYVVALMSIAILGPVLTLLPTLVLTRKYLKV
ncbi:permease-like cell division protein FtsX [Nocardioides sp. LMS-CY]|uniref:Cell division protein FtsX n=1 Tax=Nocardioides soli TaxID=1036020 RepID=A0A7W4VTB6_9ACTN|nr:MULTISPECIES: permease-like cell division protein FtsX [Nocardioides]MBB3041128.1 cell division transport system permease protein [Nocardioides soli]QWF23556.1 permease-like cell division protein FtsX [Nocardioides sp. LMS-CY]